MVFYLRMSYSQLFPPAPHLSQIRSSLRITMMEWSSVHFFCAEAFHINYLILIISLYDWFLSDFTDQNMHLGGYSNFHTANKFWSKNKFQICKTPDVVVHFQIFYHTFYHRMTMYNVFFFVCMIVYIMFNCEFALLLSCSVWALSGLNDALTQWGGPSPLFTPPIQTLISFRNIFTNTPRSDVLLAIWASWGSSQVNT